MSAALGPFSFYFGGQKMNEIEIKLKSDCEEELSNGKGEDEE